MAQTKLLPIVIKYKSSNSALAIGTSNTLQTFATLVLDTHNSWNGSKFTAVRNDKFRVTASVYTNNNITVTTGNVIALHIYKNGVFYSTIGITRGNGAANVSYQAQGSDVVELTKDDYIEIYAASTGAATQQSGSDSLNYVTIESI